MSVVIVGAGHAGGSTAAFLRQFGYADRITLVGAEPLPPYQRPPLSKAWLKGEADAESLLLKPESWYAAKAVDLRLGQEVSELDLAAARIRLTSGAGIAFEHLVLATGARARPLLVEGADLYNVLALRDAADAERLKSVLAPGRRLAVIGGGYVGLEAAASARALGADAVVIEREARVLARVASEELSEFYMSRHAARGVSFILRADVQAMRGENGRVAAVVLADGREVECDAVLVGVGAIPNVELASAAGLACDGGVVVDAQARTSHAGVFAVGDVTRRPLAHYDRMHRLESVPNALEQARQAAGAICGRPPAQPEVPWFWSDQYEFKLQIAGLPFDCDCKVLRGDSEANHFAIFHLHEGAVRAVEAVNSAPEFMFGRQMIQRGVAIDPHALADASTSLKQLLC